jgi:hypothetical protein
MFAACIASRSEQRPSPASTVSAVVLTVRRMPGGGGGSWNILGAFADPIQGERARNTSRPSRDMLTKSRKDTDIALPTIREVAKA